jgi:hypothetical protein
MSNKKEEAFDAEFFVNGPESLLEIAYLEAFLRSKGYRLSEICRLPENEARSIMTEACRYASSRLAEVEADHVLDEIRRHAAAVMKFLHED